MSDNEIDELTHHAMLTAWGQVAQSSNLIQSVEDAVLHQETFIHLNAFVGAIGIREDEPSPIWLGG